MQRTRFRGIAARVFGVPGFIAHRNLSRSTSKGRVTVAALAVSVALLIISGIIGDTLGYAGDTALDTYDDVDLGVRIDATSSESGTGALVREDGVIDGTALQDSLARLHEDAMDIDGAQSLGYYTSYVMDVIVPASMVSDDSEQFFGSLLADDRWSGPVYIDFVDDASWRAYIAELGLSEDAYCDPSHPRAVALNDYDYSNGGTYGSYAPLATGGTIEAVTFVDMPGMYAGGVVSDEDGDASVWFNAPDGSEQFVPLDDALATRTSIEVGALADTAPAGISSHTNTMHLVLPASAVPALDLVGFVSSEMSFSTDGSADRASEFQTAFKELARSYPELDCVCANYAQSKANTRMMSDTIQTFIYCFTAITGLIAVANVFNTLTNSLILRRREFAVLKSVGMGNHAFRRMIAYECASYATRGFVIGLALATMVAFLVGSAMSGSFTTYRVELPWTQVALSAAIVLAVIIVSVVYALHRSRASSVVEALREDAI